MRPSVLRNMTVEEIRQKEKDLRRELFNLRFQKATGEIQNPKRITAVRKDISRMLTIIAEKESKQER